MPHGLLKMGKWDVQLGRDAVTLLHAYMVRRRSSRHFLALLGKNGLALTTLGIWCEYKLFG